MKRSVDKFNFFIPATFKKGRKGNRDVIRVKGIASSSSVEDSDGETLFPSGFDYSPLLQRGYLNWDHQTKNRPSAIVGEPDVAKVINDGKEFYIEGFLYDSKEAQEVATLAEVLERNSSTRRLGYSIEGQVLERGCGPEFLDPKKTLRNPNYDPKLWKQVKRARITGVAITPCPKNPNTLLSLVKGEYNDLFVENEDLEEGDACPKCGAIYQDSGCPKCGYIETSEKAFTAEGSQHLQPESVEGDPRRGKAGTVGQLVRKSEIYDLIAENYTTDIEKAKRIYALVEQVNEKMFNMQKNEISMDAVEKAFEFLKGIDVNEGSDSIVKSKTEEDEGIDFDKACTMCKGFLAEGMNKGEVIDALVKSGVELQLAETVCESCIQEASNLKENGGTVTAASASTQTGKGDALNKSEENEFEKNIDQSFAETQELIKGLHSSMDNKFHHTGIILGSLNEQNALLKSQINELSEQNKEMTERLSKLEETPIPTKSLRAVGAQERFEKSGNGANQYPAGVDVYDLRNPEDKKDLLDRLDAEIEKSKSNGRTPAAFLMDAINEIEMVGTVTQKLKPSLKVLNIAVK